MAFVEVPAVCACACARLRSSVCLCMRLTPFVKLSHFLNSIELNEFCNCICSKTDHTNSKGDKIARFFPYSLGCYFIYAKKAQHWSANKTTALFISFDFIFLHFAPHPSNIQIVYTVKTRIKVHALAHGKKFHFIFHPLLRWVVVVAVFFFFSQMLLFSFSFCHHYWSSQTRWKWKNKDEKKL